MLYTWLICIVLLFFSGVLQGFADVYMFVGEPQGRKEPSKGLGFIYHIGTHGIRGALSVCCSYVFVRVEP